MSRLRFESAANLSGTLGLTFDFKLLKEQNKYNQIPSALLDQLQRILPLGEKVADDVVCEETEILEKVIQQMFKVMQEVAEFSCNYVKGSRRLCSGLDKR